jgi:hypothetical protein
MFREVPLPKGVKGKLYLDSMPARPVWVDETEEDMEERWHAFLAVAMTKHLDRVVCLTSMAEARKKSPKYAGDLDAGTFPYPWLNFAIEDYGAPAEADWEAFARFVRDVAQCIKAGENVLLHCAGGVGRTGTTAICLMHHFGLDHDEALSLILASRSEPETREQEELIEWHANQVTPDS